MSSLFVARFEPLDKRTGFCEDRASMIENGRPLSVVSAEYCCRPVSLV